MCQCFDLIVPGPNTFGGKPEMVVGSKATYSESVLTPALLSRVGSVLNNFC